MTMDDGNSVYVGGLPYDVTEETLQRVFSVYGSVISVKIVNDRSIRGKCYGFVTFTNRRSADDAIEDMDGKTIGGRAVRVNEVTTRGGRLNPGRGHFRQHSGWDRSHDKESDYSYERDRYSDRSRERDRSQDRRKDHFMEKERPFEHPHDQGRRKERHMDRKGYEERILEGDAGEWRGDRSYGDHGRGGDGADAHHVTLDEGRGEESKREDSSIFDSARGREHFSNSSGEHNYQVKEQLEASIERREVLQDEVLLMEERLEEQNLVVSELQKKSKRLEDALINEKKLTSQRRKELAKLYKTYLRVRESSDNLKTCEQELQSLVSSTMREGETGVDFYGRDEVLGNGYA